jgi:hypothetical protein
MKYRAKYRDKYSDKKVLYRMARPFYYTNARRVTNIRNKGVI